MILLLITVAGGVGAGCRFVLDGILRSRVPSAIPLGTQVINVSGSLLLGFVTGLVLFHAAPQELSLVLGTGFLGGYTTFSTASLETVWLIQGGRLGLAVAGSLGMLVLSIAAAAGGMAIAAAL